MSKNIIRSENARGAVKCYLKAISKLSGAIIIIFGIKQIIMAITPSSICWINWIAK